ncbi:iron chaperone [Lactococcus garvieae]|uniref:iron chaperone n=1 Tax=Lactococcus garvieae TaxID=1363 RepID=UPI0002E7A563|nr:DUF1801 domain-containing protein [Lactococcus garvieae]
MNFEDYFDDSELMKLIRKTVIEIFPQAQERISYSMPAWFADKNALLYAQPTKLHLGLYPKPDFINTHSEELEKKYKCTKGTIKIPYSIDTIELQELVKKIIEWNLIHPK